MLCVIPTAFFEQKINFQRSHIIWFHLYPFLKPSSRELQISDYQGRDGRGRIGQFRLYNSIRRGILVREECFHIILSTNLHTLNCVHQESTLILGLQSCTHSRYARCNQWEKRKHNEGFVGPTGAIATVCCEPITTQKLKELKKPVSKWVLPGERGGSKLRAFKCHRESQQNREPQTWGSFMCTMCFVSDNWELRVWLPKVDWRWESSGYTA